MNKEDMLFEEARDLLGKANHVFAELDYECAMRSQAEHDYQCLQEIMEHRGKEGENKK